MITREQAKEKMYQHLLSDYDLTRKEAKHNFEMKLIDKIYDSIEKEIELNKY